MPSHYCLIHIRTSKETTDYQVLEISPKVWNAVWAHEDDHAIYDYRLEQCKHPDTPDATEDNAVVKFRFNKDRDMTFRFSWFGKREEALAAMIEILEEKEKNADAKGETFEWIVRNGGQERGIEGGAKMVGKSKGKNVWWDILEVKFDDMVPVEEK